jgi:hypothetical protein
MNDRKSVWSEAHNSYDDITHATSGDESSTQVDDRVTADGIIVVGNCGNCGRQWKGLCPWVDIQQFFLGQDVPNTKRTRSGYVLLMGCPCGKATPMAIGWDEVRKYVDVGVRAGVLRPELYRVAAGLR